MKPFLIFSFLIFCSSVAIIFPQTKDTLSTYYYKQGLTAISMDNTENAKDLFKKSIRKEKNAPSEYELAKIYKADTSHSMWNISREHIKKAIKLDLENPEFHLFYGLLAEDLVNMSRLEFDTIEDAIRQYKITLKLDSTYIIASERLGEILSKRFLEYNNSIQIGGPPNTSVVIPFQKFRTLGRIHTQQIYNNIFPDGYVTFDKFAGDAFKVAESSFIYSIKYDSLNPELYLKLASIYEDHNEPEKGIKYLQKLTRLKPENKDAHLNLALLYSRSSQYDSAYYEFKKAIALMADQEREDFVYNSVKILLEPILKDKLNDYDKNSLNAIIDYFWKSREPLNLTNYNERLVEHYTRVAYSNLRFSVPKLGITGWKTDRGNIVIRYGIPFNRTRIRPNVVRRGLSKIAPKTEIWKYSDKVFSFMDQFMNGEYIFGVSGQSQYWDDSQEYSENLKATDPEDYTPKFEGPYFSVTNTAYQLKSFDSPGKTDLYISYGIKPDKQIDLNKDYNYKHTSGIFFFDQYFNKLAENKSEINYLNWKNKIDVPDTGNLFVNTRELIAEPDSGNLSFEIMRDKDKGVSSYRGRFRLRNFNSQLLEMSDIILASQVNRNSEISGRINRNEYSILPNPTGIFSKEQEMYIYYEVYNLGKNPKGLTNFKQSIILQKKDDEGAISKIFLPLLKLIGIDNEEKQVSLTSNYQTKDKDSEIYLQLDMNDYEPGNYILTIKIKDDISGKETEQNTKLTWK